MRAGRQLRAGACARRPPPAMAACQGRRRGPLLHRGSPPSSQWTAPRCGTVLLCLQYTEHLYRTVFGQHGAFRLRENGKPPQPPLC